ncbi:MAG TPA: PH domain-containing protein [Gammaproteobacteria bacterium]|nr:PH domain-containing protein [Gammaproteobacteria bacterium]
MSRIEKNLLADEQILYRTRKHWIIFFAPTVWALAALFFALNKNPWVVMAAIAPAAAAVILGLGKWLDYITSEFVLTNKRVMMREGFFTRHSNELRLATVSNMNVDQSLIGQFFDYGTVIISPFGGREDVFTEIAHPFEFQRQVQAQLDKVAK